jgi:hypothetical protein
MVTIPLKNKEDRNPKREKLLRILRIRQANRWQKVKKKRVREESQIRKELLERSQESNTGTPKANTI